MEDRVGDRRADAGRAELADPARAERARVRVDLVDEVDVDRGHVRADRDEVAGQVLRQEPPEAVVDLRRLQQRLADAPGDAADHLAAGRLRIDDPTGAVDGDGAANARDAERLVDADLDEHRAEAVDRIRLVLADTIRSRRRPLAFGRDLRLAAPRDDLGVAALLDGGPVELGEPALQVAYGVEDRRADAERG